MFSLTIFSISGWLHREKRFSVLANELLYINNSFANIANLFSPCIRIIKLTCLWDGQVEHHVFTHVDLLRWSSRESEMIERTLEMIKSIFWDKTEESHVITSICMAEWNLYYFINNLWFINQFNSNLIIVYQFQINHSLIVFTYLDMHIYISHGMIRV